MIFFSYLFFFFDSIRFVPCALISIKLCVIRSVIHSGIHSGIRHVPPPESQFRLWDYCHPWSRWESLCALSQCQHNEKLFLFSHFLHFLFAISLAAFWTSPWGFVRHWFAQNRTESDRIALNLTTLVGQKKNFCSRVSSHRSASNWIENENETNRMTSSTRAGGGKLKRGGERVGCESLKGFCNRTRDNVKLIYETPVAGKGCSQQDRSGSGECEGGCQVKVMSERLKFILICLNFQQVTLSNPKVTKIPCMLSQSELIRIRSCLLYLYTDP